MSLSSVKSETALRSRLFSSSRSFRRFTCSLFSPPNSWRHREYVTSLTPIWRIASTMFWPCETRTSTCRSFATISSGLYRFLAIAVLLDVKGIPQVGPRQWGWINGVVMEMHQVRYFLAMAKTLSFTRAAELCHVSQPALTTAIKKLETRLGSSLFHREGRSLLMTEFGRQMLPHLEQIVGLADAAETVAKNFRLLNQVPVRIGVMSTIGPMRVAGLLAAFEQKCPGVDVAVNDGAPEALAAQLDADELDVAILNPMEGLGDTYRTEPLYSERI